MNLAYKRNTALTLIIAAILALSAIIVTAGYVLTTKQVAALTTKAYVPVDLSDPWTQPRGHVSGGYTASANSLELNVDNTNPDTTPNPAPPYYATEGVSKVIPDSSAVKADLYLDPDWQTKDVRVGLWGQVYSPTHTLAGYPIIEFTTVGDGGFTGFRAYDTRGGVSQKWYNLTSVPFTYGETYNLGIAFNESTENYDFSVNGNVVLSLPASRSDDDNTPRGIFRNILFFNYNNATSDPDDDYSALWTNAQRETTQEIADPIDPTPATPASSSVPGVPNTGRR